MILSQEGQIYKDNAEGSYAKNNHSIVIDHSVSNNHRVKKIIIFVIRKVSRL